MVDRPIWKVYVENYNKKCIEEYNIFDHGRFWEACQHHWINAHNRFPDNNEQCFACFIENIMYELRYYFWGKSQWEIELTSLFPIDFKNKKIDVYSQIMLNIDVFTMYLALWFLKKEKESKKNG